MNNSGLWSGMGSLIGSVATTDDIAQIKSIVQNLQINTSQRLAAFSGIFVMYVCGKYDRQSIIDDLKQILQSIRQTDDSSVDNAIFVASIIGYCSDLVATELYPLVVELFDLDKVDPSIISKDDFEKEISPPSPEEVLSKLRKHYYNLPVTDIIESMSEWACFRKKEPAKEKPTTSKPAQVKTPIVKTTKVGRNDPCSCGSGKKYKKCCL